MPNVQRGEHEAGVPENSRNPAGPPLTTLPEPSAPPAPLTAEPSASDPGAPEATGPNRSARHSQPAPPPSGGKPRRISLDVVRGMMCVFILFVDAWYTMPEWWDHAAWYGVHGQDLVFPFFIAVSGIGLGFASSGGVRIWSTLNRFVILFVVGLLYNLQESFMFTGEFTFDTLRVTGVLQAFGFVSVVIALLHYVLRTWWAWLIGTCVMAIIQLIILRVVAGGCADGQLTLECNPGFGLDKAVFGLAHMYNQGMDGHDPEGLWAMFGMVITASVGVTVAHALGLRPGRPFLTAETGRRYGQALLCLAVFAGLAWGASQFTITMKKLWTTPFALGTGAALVLIWVILTVILDHGRWALFITVLTYPLVALGRNALLVYFGDQVLLRSLFFSYPEGSDTSWAMTLAHDVGATDENSGRFIAFMLLSWIVVAIFLHRRKLYIRP